ncbi:MAG: HAD family hydrolase [Halovenus sp.]
MSTFDAILFDLDGTLCRRTQDTEVLYAAVFERVGEEPFGEPAELWAALDGPPDHDDWIGYLGAGFARLAARHGRTAVDPVELAEALASLSDETAVELVSGAREALDSAIENGPIGVVTNGPKRRQQPKLDTLELAHLFDVIVYGADRGRQKPHTDAFDHALAELGLPADRVLYVGNSLEYDVAGAQNAGLPVAWLRDTEEEPGAYSPAYVIESLAELPEILAGKR